MRKELKAARKRARTSTVAFSSLTLNQVNGLLTLPFRVHPVAHSDNSPNPSVVLPPDFVWYAGLADCQHANPFTPPLPAPQVAVPGYMDWLRKNVFSNPLCLLRNGNAVPHFFDTKHVGNAAKLSGQADIAVTSALANADFVEVAWLKQNVYIIGVVKPAAILKENMNACIAQATGYHYAADCSSPYLTVTFLTNLQTKDPAKRGTDKPGDEKIDPEWILMWFSAVDDSVNGLRSCFFNANWYHPTMAIHILQQFVIFSEDSIRNGKPNWMLLPDALKGIVKLPRLQASAESKRLQADFDVADLEDVAENDEEREAIAKEKMLKKYLIANGLDELLSNRAFTRENFPHTMI